MALYDKQELVKMAEEAIKRNNLFFVHDIVAWLPCSNSTFYELFPDGSDELDYLKRLLNENKIRTKSAIRSKLFKSDKAGELLALYRLICTPDERRMLNPTSHGVLLLSKSWQPYLDFTHYSRQCLRSKRCSM